MSCAGRAYATAGVAGCAFIALHSVSCTGLPADTHAPVQGHGQDRVMSPALAESLLRQLLPEVAPQRFQHLMRIIRNDFFMLLDSRAMCRHVPPACRPPPVHACLSVERICVHVPGAPASQPSQGGS